MKRTVDYHWHLAELMARNGLHNSTDLLPRLAERGISLSPSQAYRLVTGRPERVSLQVIAALCDLLDCEIGDLVTLTAGNAARRARPTADNVVALNDPSGRPTRARIIRDD